jgi:hypothetical protein
MNQQTDERREKKGSKRSKREQGGSWKIKANLGASSHLRGTV